MQPIKLRWTIGVGLLVLVLVGWGIIADPAVIRVPEDYGTIGEALAAASPGDTILVGPGTYEESLLIDKKGITLKCATGALIKGDPTSSLLATISINADDVTVEGCTITGAKNGIRVFNADNVTLKNNEILKCGGNGILADGSYSNLNIEGNKISENGGDGVRLEGHGKGVTVKDNRIADNGGFGVRIGPEVSGVTVEGNTITGNTQGGVHPE